MSSEYPVRILCVMSTLNRGGAESMVMSLFRNLDRNIVIFDFVKHSKSEGTFEQEIMQLGGKIYCAPRYKIYNHLEYVSWWKRFLLNHPEYNIIHGHFFTISAVYFSVAQKLGRKTIGHIHSARIRKEQVTRPLVHKISNILIGKIERYSNYCMACSEEAGNWVYKTKPFIVLNNAINIDVFKYSPAIRNTIRKQFGIDNELVVGTVANYSKVKNPMGLIDIFINVKAKNYKAKLILIGSGQLRELIEERIKQERLEDDVWLLGGRNDVPEILQALDAFLLPSFSEGLPVSLIEAQASGLPCYVSNRVTREADITGNCKFLPIDKPEIWANEILNNSYIRNDTSECIRRAGYDIAGTAKWLQDFYLKVSNVI